MFSELVLNVIFSISALSMCYSCIYIYFWKLGQIKPSKHLTPLVNLLLKPLSNLKDVIDLEWAEVNLLNFNLLWSLHITWCANLEVRPLNKGELKQGENIWKVALLKNVVPHPYPKQYFWAMKFPICQLLDLDPGVVWGSTHKFSAKSVGGNGPFWKKSVFLPYEITHPKRKK